MAIELEKLKKEYKDITEQLTDPELISDWEKFQDLSKRRSQLEKVIQKSEEVAELSQRIEENNQIISSQEDELASLAQEELTALTQQKTSAEEELQDLLDTESADLPESIIMEIRPGTGGDEASLFAWNLFEMYTKYAVQKDLKHTVLELNQTELGGIREATIEFQGKEAAKLLLKEAGIHRVQRIPTTEKQGRIHTSTASVAILPKPKKTEININPAELKMDTFNSSGPGGQNVNKRKTAVRITHVPTGTVVESQASRNQQQNREFALTILATRLAQQKESVEGAKIAGARKEQIGSAERSEKIRTYNYPQDRITDHRIKKSWHGIERILGGDLDEITTALRPTS